VTAAAETDLKETCRAGAAPDRVNAIGTRLRLRALAAMGHSAERIARALGEPAWVITKIMTGAAPAVTPPLRADVMALYDAWWDKRPPERTPAERAAATAARSRARRGRWCTGGGLDDDELDVPGYVPRSTWRPATGTGVADDDPLGRERLPAKQMEA
jgi:hypothetical protein